jgi:hypothetical protein
VASVVVSSPALAKLFAKVAVAWHGHDSPMLAGA